MYFRVALAFSHRRNDGSVISPLHIEAMEQQCLALFKGLFQSGQVVHHTGEFLTLDGKDKLWSCSCISAYTPSVEHALERLWSFADMLAQILEEEGEVLLLITNSGEPFTSLPIVQGLAVYLPERSLN